MDCGQMCHRIFLVVRWHVPSSYEVPDGAGGTPSWPSMPGLVLGQTPPSPHHRGPCTGSGERGLCTNPWAPC